MHSFYLQLTEKGPSGICGWLFFLVLWPLSGFFGLVSRLRMRLYSLGIFKTYRAPVPVISVGNLTVGGTGKTPVVDALAKALIQQGKQVAIVSRGYQGSFSGVCSRVALPDRGEGLTAAQAGDEPFLLAVRNPDVAVYVARKRRHGVAAAAAEGADCVILDDAFQHIGVARDLDIVLLDSRAPYGNGSLLPAGNLREKPDSLQRAHIVVLTHSTAGAIHLPLNVDSVKSQHRFADHLVDLNGQRVEWSLLKEKKCLAFAGIARPGDFFSKLRDADCNLTKTFALNDHQKYCADVLDELKAASADVDFLLTTEKDAVKLWEATFPKPCLAVPLQIEFDDFDVIMNRLDANLGLSNG